MTTEGFETLERAFELGATDDAIVRRLARMYSSFGRNREGGQFLERVAESRADCNKKRSWFFYNVVLIIPFFCTKPGMKINCFMLTIFNSDIFQ